MMGESIDKLRKLDRWLTRRLKNPESGGRGEGDVPDDQALRLLRFARSTPECLQHSPLSSAEFSRGLAAELAETGQVERGVHIGPFELDEPVGCGGMGVVYRARRVVGGFEQRVALKILSGVHPDPVAVARFERERDLLSRLEHPGIARLIDGGVTGEGRPWFAMEYVDGRAIDEWCREYRLGVRERIELVIQVCEALEFAHGQLVLHRDIKPANILVDKAGRVRLVDFGLGGIQAELASGQGEVTQWSRRWLTPQYASPEQLQGRAIEVRSEVYQLGLLLYRLLCTDSPYDVSTESPADWIKAVTQAAPKAPSVRWRNDGEAAREFGISARQLSRRLKGDLDTIVLMALRKEPERRYGNVRSLGEDLQRYLDGQPVQARSDGLGYGLRKFAARHPGGLAASLIAGVIAVTGTVVHIDRLQAERDRAQLEAEKAQVVSKFLTDLFEVANPVSDSGEPFTVESLVEAGVERIADIDKAPLSQAAILRALSAVNQNIGDYETAAELRQMEVAVLEGESGIPVGRLAEALTRLGLAHYELVDFDQAEVAYQQAQRALQGVPGLERERAELFNAVGNLMRARSRFEIAEQYYRDALEFVRISDPGSSFEATILNNLGTALVHVSRYQEARNFFEQALAIRRAELGPTHAWTTIPLGNLAYTLSELGNFAGAEALYRQVIENRIEALGEMHPRVAVPVHQVGRLKWEQRDYEGARIWLERALEIQRKTLGDDHPYLAVGQMYLSQVLIHEGRLDEAESMTARGLEILRSAYDESHRFVALGLWAQAELHLAQGKLEMARSLFRQSADIRREIHGDGHRDVARSLGGLARVYRQQGEHQRARRNAEAAMAIYRRLYEFPNEVAEVEALAGIAATGVDSLP